MVTHDEAIKAVTDIYDEVDCSPTDWHKVEAAMMVMRQYFDEQKAADVERYAAAILTEEMGEVLQLIGKGGRFGMDTPGVKDPLTGLVDMDKTPRSLMGKELGDVAAATGYAGARGLVDPLEVAERSRRKFAKLTDPEARDNLGRRLAP